MPEKTVFDQYKEMIEKTKQLHSELVELSSKVCGMVDRIDTDLSDSIVPVQRISMPDSDVDKTNSLGSYPVGSLSVKWHDSDIKD